MRRLAPALLPLFLAGSASADPGFHLCGNEERFRLFAEPPSCQAGGAPASAPAPPEPRRLFDKRTMRLSGAMLLAVPIIGYIVWWRKNDLTEFRFANEGWFDADTYSGGADKVSHFVASSILGHGLERFYENLGHTRSDARWLAIGAVTITGLVVEAGDGFKYGGASWQDAVMNVGGGVLGAQIAYRRLGDAVGLRFGYVPEKNRGGETEKRVGHYSQEIYTVDAKLGGILRRSGLEPGPLRFLMLSATYGTRGYAVYGANGYEDLPAELRERDLGLELGLNIPEILRALGFPERRWWQSVIYQIFSFFRVPYTGIGFRYDFDHRRWRGPDIGN